MLTNDEIETARPRLLQWAQRRLGPDDAEDAAQETLIRAMQSYQRRPDVPMMAYLHRVLRNVVVDMLRAREREAVGMERLADHVAEQDDVPALDVAVLSKMPDHLHDAVVARLDGHTYEEIGAARGISIRAARYRVHAGVEMAQRLVIVLGYRSAEEMFEDVSAAVVYRPPVRTGSALARERQGRMK